MLKGQSVLLFSGLVWSWHAILNLVHYCEITLWFFLSVGATDIDVEPDAGSDGIIDVQVGDSINCTARGQPEPSTSWAKVSGPGKVTSVNGKQLKVTSDMVGRNVFNCTAKNTFNETDVSVMTQVTFDAGKCTKSLSLCSFLCFDFHSVFVSFNDSTFVSFNDSTFLCLSDLILFHYKCK